MKPYTIKLFMPDGTPDAFKIISKMNWTGLGLEISRDAWETHKEREEFQQAGIYILFGYTEDSDLPTIYVGQGDGVKGRIDDHYKKKNFWDKVLVFVSSNEGLNRAHITWIERALIEQAEYAKRCKLNNGNSPNEPILTEYEKADTQEFLDEMLSIFPLVGIKIFDETKKIKITDDKDSETNKTKIHDTVVVPANEDGFKEVFLGEDCWYAIRISGGRLNKIKYIAGYQTAPVKAITHIAEVESIESWGDGTKYKLNFKSSAKKIKPIIKYGDYHKRGYMLSPKYANYEKLMKSKTFKDLFG